MRFLPRLTLRSLAVAFGLGLGSFGCGDDGDGGSGGGAAGGGGGGEVGFDGHRILRLNLALTTDDPFACLAEGAAVELGLVVDVTANAEQASGWVAGTAIGTAIDSVRITHGSAVVEGAVESGELALEPFTSVVTPLDSFAFDRFVLDAAADGTVSGLAEGLWSIFSGSNWICEVQFTATVSGADDIEPPSVWPLGGEGSPVLPFEPVELVLTEPVELAGLTVVATASGAATGATVLATEDEGREGFARAISIAPEGAWATGSTLALTVGGLRDAAGNDAEVSLEPIALAEAPQSADNLGFEDGLLGWLTDPLAPAQPGVIGVVFSAQSQEVLGAGGEALIVLPPEGRFMVVVGINGRLIGYLEPPVGSTAVALTLGLIDPDLTPMLNDGEGYLVELIDRDGQVVASMSGDPAVFAPPSPTWSGFGTIELSLPADLEGGVWLLIAPVGFAPPVHLPELIVDDVRFVP